MLRRTERRALWGIAPGDLRAALDRQQEEARHRIQALQAEVDAERAEQERLEKELGAGRERLSGLLAEVSRAAQQVDQMKAGLALAAGVLGEEQTRSKDAAEKRLRELRLEEVRLRADLAEARRALRATVEAIRSALPDPDVL